MERRQGEKLGAWRNHKLYGIKIDGNRVVEWEAAQSRLVACFVNF